MKKTFKISITLVLLTVLCIIPSIVGANSESMILKESEKYLIYNEKIINNNYTFALSAENTKENLIFFSVAKDSISENAKNVAYIDNTNQNYLDEKSEAYLFVRDIEGNYVIDAEKISLKDAIDAKMIENIAKRIKVNTTKTNTVEGEKNGIKTEVTKGKIAITDNKKAKYSYMLIKLPTEGENDYTKLMNLAKKISNKETIEKLDFMQKLELMREFYIVYKELEPTEDDRAWIEVKNMEILQPEDSKTGEQYVVFIKSTNENNTIIDAQFMTCFNSYTPLYEKENIIIKETSRLPITYDSIALIMVFSVIVIAIIIILIIRSKLKKEESNKREEKEEAKIDKERTSKEEIIEKETIEEETYKETINKEKISKEKTKNDEG